MYNIKPDYKPFIFLLDLLGNIIFFPLRFKKFPKDIKKILIIRLDHIGDMILTTPVFKSVKSNYPKAKVHVLCREITKPIIKNNPYIDRVISFNPPWFARNDRSSTWINKIKKLRKEKYDLIIELKSDPRNILIAFLIKGYKVGFASRGMGFLLNKQVKWDKKIKHIVLRNLDILKAIKVKKIFYKLELFNQSIKSKKIENILNKSNSEFILGINPGVGAPEREWPIEKFAKLINLINNKFNAKIVLFDNNTVRTKKIMKNVVNKKVVLDLSGKLNLSELIEAIKKCDLFIGLESAAIHIASAVGTPCIDIHSGVTYKKEWGPYQGKSIILQNFVGHYASKKKKIWSMESIKESRVIAAISKLSKDFNTNLI